MKFENGSFNMYLLLRYQFWKPKPGAWLPIDYLFVVASHYYRCVLPPLTHHSLRSLLPQRGRWVGGVGGRQRSCRLPPQLLSDSLGKALLSLSVAFMVKLSLKESATTCTMGLREEPKSKWWFHHYIYRVSGAFSSAEGPYIDIEKGCEALFVI